ncbi:hypothetical protein OS31_36510 [Dickeya oryzae]
MRSSELTARLSDVLERIPLEEVTTADRIIALAKEKTDRKPAKQPLYLADRPLPFCH